MVEVDTLFNQRLRMNNHVTTVQKRCTLKVLVPVQAFLENDKQDILYTHRLLNSDSSLSGDGINQMMTDSNQVNSRLTTN